MNVLLTGVTGFLGSHLGRALLDRGDAVLAYRRRTSVLSRLVGVTERIAWFDLDAGEIARPFDDARIDAIVHAATCYGRAREATSEVISANVLLPLQIVDIAKEKQCPIFVNIDSFFCKAEPAYQNAPRYIMTKRHLREWLRIDTAASLAVQNLRLEHVYGPGDAPTKFVPALLAALAAHQPRLALTPGEQRRDFIYVTDAISAILCVLDHTSPAAGFSELEIGTGEPHSVREMAETARSILRSTTTLGFGDLPYIQGELMHSHADLRPLRELGWSPSISLEEGLRRMALAAALPRIPNHVA